MAWLERDRADGPFSVVFRVGSRRIKRSARTSNEREASEVALRVERRLRLIEEGELVVPEDVDVATFVMSEIRSLEITASPLVSVSRLFESLDRQLTRLGWSDLQHDLRKRSPSMVTA